MKRLAVTAAALVVLTIPAGAQMQTPSQSTSPGMQQSTTMKRLSAQEFVRNAAIANMYELQAAKLAVQRAQSQQTRNLAQMITKDHERLDDQLRATLKQADLSSIDIPTQLDKKHQGMIEQLQRMSGPPFDRLYEQQQAQAHEQTIRLFQSYAENGDNSELKQLAQQSMSDLEQHLHRAEALIKANQTTGTGGSDMKK